VGDAVYLWGIGLPLIPSAGNRAAIAAEGEGVSNLTAAYDGVHARGPCSSPTSRQNRSPSTLNIRIPLLHRTGAVRTSENPQLTNFGERRQDEVRRG
jgi:hypothetical protein